MITCPNCGTPEFTLHKYGCEAVGDQPHPFEAVAGETRTLHWTVESCTECGHALHEQHECLAEVDESTCDCNGPAVAGEDETAARPTAMFEAIYGPTDPVLLKVFRDDLDMEIGLITASLKARAEEAEAKVGRLEAALFPFACLLDPAMEDKRDDDAVWSFNGNAITCGDLRRARALAPVSGTEE